MVLTTVLATLITVLLSILYYIKHSHNYWKNRNVPYIQPIFPIGNFWGVGRKFNLYQMTQTYYNQLKNTKAPFLGVYFLSKPMAIALDLDFVKNVLIKDFNHFSSRGLYYNERDDPLSAHLVNIEGHKWRKLRTKLTPTFTSGKIKYMFPVITQVSEELIKLIQKRLENGETEMEMFDILGRYTTDVIGTCAFGIDCNTLHDPNAIFRIMGKKVFNSPRHSILQRMLISISTKYSNMMGIKQVHDDVSKFFHGIVKETVEHRETNNITRNDFMDLLIQLKNKGKLDHDGQDDEYIEDRLTLNEIAAQAFVFFLAGFETSSTLLTFCLLELANNQIIQNKVREEVNQVIAKFDGKFTYEALGEMHYLKQVLNETLRKYPPVAIVPRKAMSDYRLPGSDLIFEKNKSVIIPIYAIHHDPEYYPSPEEFDPNRFTAEEIKNRNPLAFIPFGEGPRNCIGLRFGLIQASVGLVSIMQNFKLELGSNVKLPVKLSPKSNFLSIDEGLVLKLSSCK